jgi:thiamine biosynthesis protein ThiI
MVAFGDIQRAIVHAVPPQFRVVLYRRVMLRLASAIAREDEAAGIVTGDSLGQVASQTLVNLRTIELATPTMLLRPLLGMDKLEIVRYAQDAGTYEISISPDQDCCSLFVPKHPGTAVKNADAERAEGMVDLAPLIESALAARTQEWVEAAWSAQAATIREND